MELTNGFINGGAVRRRALILHEKVTGRHILARLEELNRTQWLSREELLELQQQKLLSLITYASQYVPYYQRVFKDIGFQPEDLRQDPGSFIKIPILTKSIIRENWNDLLTTEPERRRQLSKLSTSGSTGEPLVFMQDRDFRDAVTADIQRHIGWAGWKLGDSQAVIWGTNPNPKTKSKIRSALIDRIWNRIQSNAFAITEESQRYFAQRVIQHKPQIMFGYVSGIQRFARYVRQQGIEIRFRGVFTSAERLLPPVRKLIEDTFKCQVYDRYGTLELGGLACECEAHAGMHISIENNIVEINLEGKSVQPGIKGDLIVTNLVNRGMPFIRYQIEDAASWGDGTPCACGRAAPRLLTLDGRIKEAIYTRDGRIVYSGFSGNDFQALAHPGIHQFQVIQKNLDLIVVRIVSDCEVSKNAREAMSRAFKDVLGESVIVDFEFYDELPSLPSGKHQYVMSELHMN